MRFTLPMLHKYVIYMHMSSGGDCSFVVVLDPLEVAVCLDLVSVVSMWSFSKTPIELLHILFLNSSVGCR